MKYVILFTFLTLLLTSLINIYMTSASPNVYYVAYWGDDSNPGSRERPWKSLGLVTGRMKSGDTLIIMEGKYILERYDEDILMPPSGRPDAWTVIRGEVGSRSILAGRGDLITAIDLSGRSYV